jgi:hypothetical protein
LKPKQKIVCNPDDAYFARQYLKRQQEEARKSRVSGHVTHADTKSRQQPAVVVSPPQTDVEDSENSRTDSSSGDSSSSSVSSGSSTTVSGADEDTFDVDHYTTEPQLHDAQSDDDEENTSETSPSHRQAKRDLKRLLRDDSNMTSLLMDATLLQTTSVANVCKGLARNTSVVKLTMDLKGISTQDDVLSLLQALECNDTLASLTLTHVDFDRFTAQALAMFLFRVPGLAELRLFHCSFDDKSAFSLLTIGIQHVRNSLKTLHLEGIPLGLSATDTAATAMSAATDMDLVSTTLPFLQTLTTLTLRNVQLPLSGWTFFLNIIDRNATAMENLDLSQNKILSTKEGMQAMVDSNLLTGNGGGGGGSGGGGGGGGTGKHGDKNTKEVFTSLKRLSLAECGLKRPAVKALVQDGFLVAANRSTLTHLELSGNVDIDDRCCRYLLQLLTNTPSIASLGLDQCPHISKKYLRELNDQLRYNNSFFKTFGISSDVSLAIMDGMQMLGDMTKQN